MSDRASGSPDLPEKETLARLTIDEKRRIAGTSVTDFPHLNHEMLDDWLRVYGDSPQRVPAPASVGEKADVLLDRCETLVRAGEDKEALDRFIYGYLYPANLVLHGIDLSELAAREPLDTWDGVYDLD